MRVTRRSRVKYAHPPLSQIPHGSSLSLAFAVKEPFVASNPQKKSVLFGWPSRCTPMLPAKLRPSGHVTFGKGSVTSKSTAYQPASEAINRHCKRRETTDNSAKTCHSRPLACPGTPAASCSLWEPDQPRVAGWQQPPRRRATTGASLRGSCRQLMVLWACRHTSRSCVLIYVAEPSGQPPVTI